MLLATHKRKGILLCIVTGDEKWIQYDNPKRKKSWRPPGHASTSTAKPNIYGKKLLLCIWWDQLGVVYYELLKPNETIVEFFTEHNWWDWVKHSRKSAPTTTPDTAKLFFCMIMLVHILQRRSKPIWKHLSRKFYPSRRIHHILFLLISTYFDRWPMACLSSTSNHMKIPKIGSIRG